MNKRKEIKELISKAGEIFTTTLAMEDLHPRTIHDLSFHIHNVQNILITEYVRTTELKHELDLI